MSALDLYIPRELERPAALDALALGLVYFALAFYSSHLVRQVDAVSNVWFANAAAMAVLASSRYSRWPLLLLTVVIANVSADVVYNSKLLFALGFVPGNVVEVALGAWLLRRGNLWRTFDRDFAAFARAAGGGAVARACRGNLWRTIAALTWLFCVSGCMGRLVCRFGNRR